MDQKNLWLILGAIGAALAVIAGAYGAYILELLVSENTMITFRKAVRYEMYHSLALIFVALFSSQTQVKAVNIAGWCFLIGILTFSGSLYLLVFTGLEWLGAITPIGGFVFVFGWISLAYSGFKNKTSESKKELSS